MREFVYLGEDIGIKQALQNNVAGMGKGLAERLLKQKEVKVNGARVTSAYVVKSGDVVRVYFNEQQILPHIVYIDNDIIVVNKRAGIETCNGEGNLLQLLKGIYGEAYAVHRLDANTTGLVMFARTEEAEQELSRAIKSRSIKKYYRAEVVGVPSVVANATNNIAEGDSVVANATNEVELVAYLVKGDGGKVRVYSNKVEGGRKIVTKISLKEVCNGNAVLNVMLVTGATHQIRSHLAFIGHPVIGDDLYGNRTANKQAGKRMQQLSAVRIELAGLSGCLARLNGRVFVLDK